jgi:hypothetical protein
MWTRLAVSGMGYYFFYFLTKRFLNNAGSSYTSHMHTCIRIRYVQLLELIVHFFCLEVHETNNIAPNIEI